MSRAPGTPVFATSPHGQAPSHLPVFALESPPVTDAQLHRVARACGISACASSEVGGRVSLRSGHRELELDRRTGMIWMADRSQLWVPRHAVGPLPTGAALIRCASERLDAAGLGPSPFPFGRFRVELDLVDAGGTRFASWVAEPRAPDTRPARQNAILDSYARLGLVVVVDGAGKEPQRIPVVGGVAGGVSFGGNGTLIGMHLSWSRLVPSRPYPLITREESEASCRLATASFEPLDVHSTLVYELVETAGGDRLLQPAWRHRVRARHPQPTHLHDVTLPATGFPRPPASVTQAVNGSAAPWRPDESAAHRVGAWWVDSELRTQRNAEAFVGQLADDGWQVAALRGGPDALKSDWLCDDRRSVEHVDLAFYAGHATARGWMLQPGNSYLTYPDVSVNGASPQRFGSGRLKWILIAGCGPLQDAVVSGGLEDVFSRWTAAFSGLHSLCGFATQVGDRPEMGPAAAALARQGETIIHAWLRGARQGQPGGGVWASAMWADAGEGPSSFDDHLPGRGPVAPTCHEPTRFGAIWTPA